MFKILICFLTPPIEQRPSTSRYCSKKQIKKRSPWKYSGGKVNRFKKILEDQDGRTIRRRVYLVKDNQVLKKVTPKKVSPQKKPKYSTNKRKTSTGKLKNKNLHKGTSTLEEGEIRSDPDTSFASTTIDVIKNNEDDEDDCIVIEPTLESITIDDIDDEIPSTSDTSTNYESLMISLRERISSTPRQNRKTPTSHATIVNKPSDFNKSKDNFLPFFVDVGANGGTESINSTENFSQYIKLSTLKEKRLKQTDKGGEVIEIDDNISDNTDSTLKRKSRDFCDDSVIFISETNRNDYIPIVDDNIPPHKILKKSDPTPKTPVNRLRTNNLFTHSETKKLNEYNENAYNPSTTKVLTTGKRMVIIDGSNVAFKHGLDQEFSVKGLKIAIEYFEKMGHEVKAVIPQFRMNRTKSTSPEDLERLHKAGKIVQTPCKNLPGHTSTSYDDRFILQLAFALDAAIVSNDNYRDLLHENPAFKKIVENRVIGYTWCNDIFILPKDPYGKWGPTLHTILNRC